MLFDLLAELPKPDSAESVGWLMLTISAGLLGVDRLLSVVRAFKGLSAPDPSKPSSDRVKAVEDRLHAVELQIATHMGGINSKFSEINQTLTNLQTDWSYSIGRIDGRREGGV